MSVFEYVNSHLPYLQPFFENHIEITCNDKTSKNFYTWFNTIEQQKFRSELRYSYEEFEELFRNPNFLILFVLENDIPQAVVLTYDCAEMSDCYYLDVIAVIPAGKVIGKYLINWLCDILEALNYTTLRLDTEEVNEHGQELRKFYETMGFEVEKITKDGNICLKKTISRHND